METVDDHRRIAAREGLLDAVEARDLTVMR